MPLTPDPYALLGVPRNADEELLRRAWRERAKRYHPDVNPSPKAAELFQSMHRAYELLRDPRTRAWVDGLGRGMFEHRTAADGRRDVFRPRSRTELPEVPRFAVVGLYLTGLLFGTTLVCGVLWQVGWNGWPPAMLFACIPGIAVLPDSVTGLLHAPRQQKAGH